VRAAIESSTGPIGRFARRCRLLTVGGGLLVLSAMTWLNQHNTIEQRSTTDSTGLSDSGPTTWLLTLGIIVALVAALLQVGRTLPVVLSALAFVATIGGLLLIPPDRVFEASGSRIDYEWSAAPVAMLILCGLLLALTGENSWAVRRGATELPELETTTPMSDDQVERKSDLDADVTAPGGPLSRALHRCLVFGCGIALLVLLTATWEKDGWNTEQIKYRTGFGLITGELPVARVAMLALIIVLAGLILFAGNGLVTMILAAAGLALTLLMMLTLPADVTTGGTAANRYELLPAPYVALVIWAVAIGAGWHARTVHHRR
jgi:hypothetical protein